MADLLDVLLSDNPADADDRPQSPWKWKKKNTEIPCQGLFTDEVREVRKKATVPTFDLKTRERGERFDSDLYSDLLILACTPDAPWTTPAVREHYGTATTVDTMRKAMRHPAEYSELLEHCMTLCGLMADATPPEEAVKNG